MNNSNLFSYPHKPIASLDKLAICLGISLAELTYLQQHSNEYFFLCKRVKKTDSSFRDTYDVKSRLKKIHSLIVQRFFKKLNYPEYLQGGIPRRDCISNAKQHLKAKNIISADISNFFPSISKKIIHEVWAKFFHFPYEVADCLAELVTYNGFLTQGCKASGYLCNLILWKREYDLVQYFKSKGITYTRYVDDITISTNKNLTNQEKSEIISKIYSLFRSVGVKPNRKKQKIAQNGFQQTVNQMNVSSRRPTIPKRKRQAIHKAVYECEIKFTKLKNTQEYKSLFSKVHGQVLYMKRLHKNEADKLLVRLELVKP